MTSENIQSMSQLGNCHQCVTGGIKLHNDNSSIMCQLQRMKNSGASGSQH